MDLSKLSSDLPLEGPIDDDSLDNLNRELSNEFKIGARSIAALYRFCSSKTGVIRAKGYLNCVNDVLSLIDNESVADLAHLKMQLLRKKAEITGKKTAKETTDKAKFTMKAQSPFHFPASRVPMAVKPQLKHHHVRPRQHSRKNKIKEHTRPTNVSANTTTSSESEATTEESSEDDPMFVTDESSQSGKRRLLLGEAVKRPKLD